MNSELTYLLTWILVIQLLGWVTFPISYRLFVSFPDRGYALAKIQGLLLSAYISWLLPSLHLLPHRSETAWLSLAIIVIIGLIFTPYYHKDFVTFLRRNSKIFVLVEIIFLVSYLIFTLIRSFNPDITGAEKEPDFTFLNAVLRSESLPPSDPWFSGESLNYYYFGYFVWAHMLRLTGIPSAIGFNLAVSTLMALSLVGAFSLGLKLTNHTRYGLLTAFLLCIAGNLDGFVQWLERGKLYPFDWWRSSRIIPDTINEFPFFSFVLGDLHAHFMSIPFALLFLSLLCEMAFLNARNTKREDDDMEARRHGDMEISHSSSRLYIFALLRFYFTYYLLLIALCLSLGAAPFINTWDFPTCLLLTLLVLFQGQRAWSLKYEGNNKPKPLSSLWFIAGRTLAVFLPLLAVSYLMYLPFHLSFKSQIPLTSSLRFVSSAQRTSLWHYLFIYGFFLFILGTFSFYRLKQILSAFTKDMRSVLLGGSALSFPILYVIFNSWAIPLTLPFTFLFLILWLKEKQFVYLLIFVATAIIIGCELVYIKDFYGHPLERQNTVFKFYYQVWILLSISVPYVLYKVQIKQSEHEREWGKAKGEGEKERKRRKTKDEREVFFSPFRTYWDYAFILLLVALLIYPVAATYEKCNRFSSASRGGLPYVPTLDGIAYIRYRYPEEYKAITWVQENIKGNPTILEATGKPYSFYGRVSATTGLPTVLGWGNHEALWRDLTWKSILDRTRDIQTIYSTPDKSDVLELLKKYQIHYIYVGSMEKQSYNALGLDGFNNGFELVYNQDGVIIYKVM
jgi:YYY domain-containing protein